MIDPREYIADLRTTAISACARATRAAIVVSADGDVIGSGSNSPPLPFVCSLLPFPFQKMGDVDCTNRCRDIAVHAEVAAILNASRTLSSIRSSDLIHARFDGDDIVNSGAPRCMECAKYALHSGIAGIWLHHQSGWRRCSAPEFYAASCRSNGIESRVRRKELRIDWFQDAPLNQVFQAPGIVSGHDVDVPVRVDRINQVLRMRVVNPKRFDVTTCQAIDVVSGMVFVDGGVVVDIRHEGGVSLFDGTWHDYPPYASVPVLYKRILTI